MSRAARLIRGLPLLYSTRFTGMYDDWRDVLANTLAAGPWCWPAQVDLAYARASQLVPSGPPSLTPGQVPLVVAHAESACLLSARLVDEPEVPASFVGLTNDAPAALRAARDAVPAALPFLWRRLQLPQGVACRHLRSPDVDGTLAAVRGRSCGLSLLLACASWALGLPARADTIAIAEISSREKPEIAAVDETALRRKLDVVWRRAPGLTRVLVSPHQARQARDFCAELGAALEIVPVSSAAAALEQEFGGLARDYVLHVGRAAHTRGPWLETLLNDLLATGRPGITTEWAPVARAVAVAMRRWRSSGITDDERSVLRFAWAVARRHQGNTGSLPCIDADWITRQSPTRQVAIVAHLVQQAHDTGSPPLEQALQLGETRLATARDQHFEMHARVLGALARLQRLHGDYDAAFARQCQALEVLSGLPDHTTFQLSEMYLLAAIRRHQAWFTRADEWRAWLLTVGRDVPWAFPDLMRARAVLCRRDAGHRGWAVETLTRLWEDRRVYDHVRWSAGRWLAMVRREDGDAEDARALASSIAEGSRGHPRNRRIAHAFATLSVIDAALHEGRSGQADALLRVLEEKQPGVVRPLLARAPASARAAFIADEFPY